MIPIVTPVLFFWIIFISGQSFAIFVIMDPVWVAKYVEKIDSGSVLGPNLQCRLWQKATRSSGQLQYGAICVKVLDAWKTVLVHRLAYILHHNMKWEDIAGLHVSHRCHNSRCVTGGHLSLEPAAVNNNRQHCVNVGRCLGHGDPYPDCLLPLKVVIFSKL